MKTKRFFLISFVTLCVSTTMFGCNDKNEKVQPTSSSDAQPVICRAFSLDSIEGCNKGEQLVFTPLSWGNEQMPINIAQYCDLSKSIVWTKAGLTCIYTGQRKTEYALEKLKVKQYGSLYESVKTNDKGWYKTDSSDYWRISEQGAGSDIVPGATIRTDSKDCIHDINGKENLASEFKEASTFTVKEGHYVYALRPKSGAVIEVVEPKAHYFFKVVMTKEAPPKDK